MNSPALPMKHQVIPLKPIHSTAPSENKLNRLDPYKNSRIILSIGEKLLFIKIDDIVRLEADGNYTQVHMTNNKMHIISKTLKQFILHLPSSHFIRIHQSHAINIFHIECIESMKCVRMSDCSKINISRRNRLELKSKLNEMTLL